MLDNQELHVAYPRRRNPQLSTQNRNLWATSRNCLCNSALSRSHTYENQYATGDATTLQQRCNFSGRKWHPKVARRAD